MAFVIVGLLVTLASSVSGTEPTAPQRNHFETKIRPVLVAHCYACHSQRARDKGNLKAKLLVDSHAALLIGGESGPAIVPGEPASSLLMKAIRHEGLEMPPNSIRLSERVASDFEVWIRDGAWFPEKTGATATSTPQHWAFQPLRPVKIPSSNSTWPVTDIDRLVLAKMDDVGVQPSARADMLTLVRRAHLDLLGLPPSRAQVEELEGNTASETYARLVEELLGSPHYGERWGRHWLDVARYGESDGGLATEDDVRQGAYKYRDAVIRAFNADLPFDKFVRGNFVEIGNGWDELQQFLKIGTTLQDNLDPTEKKFHVLDDLVATTGSAFLGLTIGCARCHDHKIDPISTAEYYRMTAVFFHDVRIEEKSGPKSVPIKVREPHLLAGGSWHNPVRPVTPGFLEVLIRGDPTAAWYGLQEESQKSTVKTERGALADWLTDVEHGGGALLARVIANRVWQHHFGRGIVATPNDFGGLGEPPTHPRLLDHLAHILIANGWRLSVLHRRIMNSAVYQQAGGTRYSSNDADNRWLWHFRPRRLEAEAIRDSMLAVSGSLDRKLFGPSISLGRRGKPSRESLETRRRSIYLQSMRFTKHPFLAAFDVPNNFQSVGARSVSTTPVNALVMMNDPFVRKRAESLGRQVLAQTDEVDEFIRLVYMSVFTRRPSDMERRLGREFLLRESVPMKLVENPNVTSYCHALLSSNEFIYIR